MFKNILQNYAFIVIFFFQSVAQIFLVYVGGEFVKTTGLSAENFLATVIIGSISLIIGFLSRLIPIKESDSLFFFDKFQKLKIKDESIDNRSNTNNLYNKYEKVL
jgi:Ca2+-transporting ATPase